MRPLTLRRLLRRKPLRAPAVPIVLMPNGRLPRYRVFIPPNALDLLVGCRVDGKYYILSVLGHGGMSLVYKAKTIGRRPQIVAFKTLRVMGLNDDMLVKRFQREADLLSHLNHPRIVQVHDHGTTRRGQPYFVMDYLTGTSLAERLHDQGPIPAGKARDIFSQVCGAVDHAHRCGLIHRDLKPGNIMLMDVNGQKDVVKVVDFGIARFQEEAQRLTRMGEVWGSPVYMSPEQCMGAPIDRRSDIYSIGICMYEALTGQVPHFGKNYVDTMSKQIGEPARPLREVRPDLDIPERMEAVVLRALQKQADDRYQTMADLRDDLEQAVSKPLVRPGEGGSPPQTTKAPQIAARSSLRDAALRGEKASDAKNTTVAIIVAIAVLIGVLVLAGRLAYTLNKEKNLMKQIDLLEKEETNKQQELTRQYDKLNQQEVEKAKENPVVSPTPQSLPGAGVNMPAPQSAVPQPDQVSPNPDNTSSQPPQDSNSTIPSSLQLPDSSQAAPASSGPVPAADVQSTTPQPVARP